MPSAHHHSFRVAKLEILARETSAPLGDATGFFCQFSTHTFLVTNWHVVTGRNFQTNVPLHPSQALPGSLKVHTHLCDNVVSIKAPSTSTAYQITLSDEHDRPHWLEHPLFGSNVDVVAIPVDRFIPNCDRIFRIDLETELRRDRSLSIMDQTFVTGFPLSATTTPNSLPIYKSATIASEPQIFDSEPRIYIDGKTKSGMSGSPVMIKRRNSGDECDELDFIGVYSGRDRQERSEFEAELGILWPFKECLVPILEQYLESSGVASIQNARSDAGR